MKYGFTGTQAGMTLQQFSRVNELVTQLGLHHEYHMGDCIGADAEFHSLVFRHGRTVCHPPSNPAKRAFLFYHIVRENFSYLERNKHIVKESVDGLIATPKEYTEMVRSGTWSTVRYARRLKRKIYIVFPDGSMKEEN